jgi:TonB-dependent receptor
VRITARPGVLALIALTSCSAAQGAASNSQFFDIPAGSAELAITEFSRQARIQIIVPSETLLGVNTPAVHGEFDSSTVLALLLKDTDLVVASDDGRTIVVRRKAPIPAPGSQHAAASRDRPALEAVTVTGYRASLERAVLTKRETTSLTESVFAEDIGKFPDTNLAESLNRIPGIILTRDANGEGVLVAIRGLSTNFTKVLLNGVPISLATEGAIDFNNSNREVDLNMFPSELFASLTVQKTPTADVIEGGAAGTVNIRTPRPFDEPGPRLTYAAQGIDNSLTNGAGANGALIASDTWDTSIGGIGFLVGIAGQHTYTMTRGWEDGNGGWVTPSITNSTLCGAPTGCDMPGSKVSIGGDALTIAAMVPSNVNIPGYGSGSNVDAAMLLALNPGLNMTQMSNMLLPRLPRIMYQRGTRDRLNAVASLEVRPTDTLQFFADFVAGHRLNDLDRSDMSWGVRAGTGALPMIPMNVSLDPNGVITRGDFANAQLGLEARPYVEKSDFLSISSGVSWEVTDSLHLDLQANASRSHYFQETPTIYVVTCPSGGNAPGIPGCSAPVGGVLVHFDNRGEIPTFTTNIDFDNPSNFQWSGGRATIRDEKRYTTTYGSHLDVSYGGEMTSVKIGAAYDVHYRRIFAIDFLTDWQQAICGGGTSSVCTGAAGSLIPQSSLSSYLYHGPGGFVSVNYDNLLKDSGYYSLTAPALAKLSYGCVGQPSGVYFSPVGVTLATSGCIEERAVGLYGLADGLVDLYGRPLHYDLGVRWVQTRQSIRSPVPRSDHSFDFSNAVRTYQAFLPSASLSYEITNKLLIRGSLSRTMTRADASQMIDEVDFSDPTALEAFVGNPELNPYFSNNMDFGAEYYMGGESYIGVALFRKWINGFSTRSIVTKPFSYLAQYGITWAKLTDMQHQALFQRAGCTSDANCSANISIEEWLNAPGTETIGGIELSYVQSLDFALSRYGLPGFGVTGNFTFIGQSSSGSAAIHAVGVAPHTLNVTGYYERQGIMARLSFVHTDRTYASGSNKQNVCLPTTQAAAAGCPDGAYVFEGSYDQADFSSSIKLSTVFGLLPSDPELTFNVQNVLDAKHSSYFQYKNATHYQYNAGRTFLIGVHGTF